VVLVVIRVRQENLRLSTSTMNTVCAGDTASNTSMKSLHFAWVVDDAKCIVVTRVCVSVCLSAAVRPHYCTDPDVTLGVVEAAP